MPLTETPSVSTLFSTRLSVILTLIPNSKENLKVNYLVII